MRKLAYVIAIGAATFSVAAVVASASTPHRVLRCKSGSSSNICLAPTTAIKPMSAACHKVGKRVKLSKITVKANAGIRRITITLDGKTVKVYRFKGKGPTQKVIAGFKIKTAGLKSGVHTVKVKTVDTRGKSSSRSRNIAICKAIKPVFTG